MELDWMVDPVAIDLARLAATHEEGGIGFYGGPIVKQVANLLVKTRAPLMLSIIS